MILPEEGAVIRIESYKHGERLHRAWKKSLVLEKGEPLVIANYNVEVVERTEGMGFFRPDHRPVSPL